jgi:hypothetical protein
MTTKMMTLTMKVTVNTYEVDLTLDEEKLADCLTIHEFYTGLTAEEKEEFWVTVRADEEAIQREIAPLNVDDEYAGDEGEPTPEELAAWGAPSVVEHIIEERFRKWWDAQVALGRFGESVAKWEREKEEFVCRWREDVMKKGIAENETCGSCADAKGTTLYDGTEAACRAGGLRRMRLLCQTCCDAIRTAEEEEEEAQREMWRH